MKKLILFFILLGFIQKVSLAQSPCEAVLTQTIDAANYTTTVVATSRGTAPFTYQWSTGGTAAVETVILNGIVPPPAQICLTLTDATGCVFTLCDSLQTGGGSNCQMGIAMSWSNNHPDSTTYTAILRGAYSGTPCITWNIPGVALPAVCHPLSITVLTSSIQGPTCVTAVDAAGCQATDCGIIIMPTCGVTFTNTLQPNPSRITFTATAHGTPPFIYLWDNGVTTASFDMFLTPTFLPPPSMCVQITDATGCSSFFCDSVRMFPPPCFSMGIVEVPNPSLGNNLQVWHQSVNNPVAVLWNTGEVTQSITVTTSGNYCATITDAIGCSQSACYYYQAPMPCQALFAVFVDSMNPQPFNLAVVNLSSGGGLLTYDWDFGDGTTGTGPFPTHSYANTGAYLLCLTITDASGCSSVFCDSIGVDASGNVIFRQGFTLNVISPTPLNVEGQNDLEMTLFPNPTSGEVQVRFNGTNEEATLAILDIMGRQIESRNIAPTAGLQVESISLTNQPAGQYLIRLVSGKSQQAMKVVKR